MWLKNRTEKKITDQKNHHQTLPCAQFGVSTVKISVSALVGDPADDSTQCNATFMAIFVYTFASVFASSFVGEFVGQNCAFICSVLPLVSRPWRLMVKQTALKEVKIGQVRKAN